MKKVAYLISHGHTARGALQTGLLERLTEFCEVHVIAKYGTADVLVESLKGTGIHVHGFKYKISRWDQQKSMLRMHVHQNIRQNPALWEKHLRRSQDKRTSRKRRWANQLYYYLGAMIRLTPRGKYIFSNWESKVNLKANATELLNTIKPDFLFSTRPVDEMEIYLLEAAKILGIHRVFYILSWDNITSKGVFPVLADTYLTWGAIMNQELNEYYGVPPEKILDTGVTHFDIHANVRDGVIEPLDVLTSIGLKRECPYIFFTMSASYFAPNEIEIVEHLADQVENNAFGNQMQLVVRPHMANLMADRSDQDWLKRLERLDSNRIKVDFPDSDNSLLTWYMAKDDMVRLSSLLNGARICLNSGSTIAIEAIYLDKPVVITAFDTEKWPEWHSARRLRSYVHLRKLFDTEACVLVDDLSQMDEAINEYLSDPSKDVLERKKAVELECFKNDGLATDRLVEHVRKLVLG